MGEGFIGWPRTSLLWCRRLARFGAQTAPAAVEAGPPDLARGAISSRLMSYRDQTGDDWADIIDFLTMHPEARRQVVRVLAEIEAASG